MASPVADSYSAAAGITLYGGRANPSTRPAWRRSMAANTWATIPGNTLASINPDRNPLINPNHPNPAPWLLNGTGTGNFGAVASDYNGGCWDEATCRLILPLQGGHGDYGGNEPNSQDLLSDTPAWHMWRNPSGAIGNLVAFDGATASSGVYSDGKLRPGHSYDYNVYYPGVGPIVSRIVGPFPGGGDDIKRAYIINEATGEATLLCDYVAIGGVGSGGVTPVGSTFVDTSRNCIFITGNGITGLLKINVFTGVPTLVVQPDAYIEYSGAGAMRVPRHDLQAFFHKGGAGWPAAFYLRDPTNSYAMIQPTITGSFPAGFSITGCGGSDWDDANNRFLLWQNATDLRQIATLTPSGDPRTAPWVAGTLAVSGSNTYTPTAPSPTGSLGRFGYSPNLGGCYLLNGVGEQTQFFATE